MYKKPYLVRLAAASTVAVVITAALTFLVMWMNGLITEDKPTAIAYTPCVFGEAKSEELENPFAKAPLTVDCVPPEDVKPLFVQWFDSILSRREPVEPSSRASGPRAGG